MIALVAALTLEALGPARAISHSSSASRDTFVLGAIYAPRRVLTGGGDFALVALAAPDWTLRLGVQAMLELESDNETTSYLPFPQGDTRFWRGVWGFSAALALDRAGCTFEGTLSARHESEHYTGPNSGGPGTDYSEVRLIGDFIMLDGAARVPLGALELVARAQYKQFLPGRSGYVAGPGGDLVVRWRRWDRLHPFTSLFAEYLVGADRNPDAFLVRDLAGVIVPSRAGDIYLFIDAAVGHRKGLAVLTEEATLGFGLRFAFY
jgi:hypothetical protein